MNLIPRIFNPDQDGEDWTNVWALGLLTQAAYLDDAGTLQVIALPMGFEQAGLIHTPGTYIPNIAWCYAPGTLLVLVPGTKCLTQFAAQVEFSGQTPGGIFGLGNVHSFFLWAAQGIVDAVSVHLATLPTDTKVVFAGHSLGGAVAQLLADYTAIRTAYAVVRCVTFNSPRVGNPRWARKIRTYRSHLYYAGHDMVVEVPTPLWVSGPQHTPTLLPITVWEHRDKLIPVTSTRDINASWAAAIFGKTGAVGGAITETLAGTGYIAGAARFLRNAGAKAYAYSSLLAIPTWWDDHKMDAVLDGLEQERGFNALPGPPDWKSLRSAISGGIIINDPAEIIRTARLVRNQFLEGQIQPDGLLANLPVIPPQTLTEVVEVATTFYVSGSVVPQRATVSTADVAMDAVVERHAATGVSPFATPGFIPNSIPNLPNWLFRGKDRRLLTKLWDVINAIESRDYLAEFGNPSAALSTRELVIDDDTREAWQAVKDHLSSLLALYYE